MTEQWEPLLAELSGPRRGKLIARARMLVPDTAAAEDLVQDALVATFAKRRGFTNAAQAEHYVRKAIVTHFIDATRRRGRETELWTRAAHEAPTAQANPEDTVPGSLHADALLHSLAPRVRACIALRYLDDLTIRETAAALKLTEGAVKRYVSDGLAVLNTALGTQETAEDDDRVHVSTYEGGQP